jgi:hypothetical protein
MELKGEAFQEGVLPYSGGCLSESRVFSGIDLEIR